MNQENKTASLACEIVRDLLPLYHDRVVSDTTSQAVESHLEGCPFCRGEYDALCLTLPEESTDSTQGQFSSMMKKVKRKRVIVTALVALAACGLLAGAIAFLYEVPLIEVPVDDLEIAQVCRFEVNGEKKFFVLFAAPLYTGYGNSRTYSDSDAPTELIVSKKVTVYSRPLEEYGKANSDWFIVPDEGYDTVRYGGQVLWTEEANGRDPVPEYVYAYDDFRENPGPYNDVFYDTKKDIIGAFQSDGRRLVWDLEGKLLADDYPDAEGNYPELP